MTDPVAGAERRARQSRAETIGAWTDTQRTWALTVLAGRWPLIFDELRDVMDDQDRSEEGDAGDG